MVSLPPRKSLPNACKPGLHRASSQSPLQVLLQMGIPKHRAEKALAATGYRGPQLAADWLLAHVNDPTLDDSCPREYILYLCPNGPLFEQIQQFYTESLHKCGWNGAHNYLPHITLCSFFQAPDDSVGMLINAFQHCVEKLQDDLPKSIKLESYTSPQFVGLFLNEEHNDILRRFAMTFMRECSDFSIEVEPYLKSLHITLGYQYSNEHRETLENLLKRIDVNAPCIWELRLYSRDQRIKGNEVHKVLYPHRPQQNDELELLIGDFVYISGDSIKSSPDGWVEGVSWLTGCSGQLPLACLERTAESDAWTLHKCIGLDNLCEQQASISLTDVSQWASQNNTSRSSHHERLPDVRERENGSLADVDPQDPKPRQLYVIRHAERIDFTFGNWIPHCFDASGNYHRMDLNHPRTIPNRADPRFYFKDSPLTVIGHYQATLTGQALKEAKVTFSHVYCSPSLRCVQTCTNILKELGLASTLKINIEPGLFEWLAWYQDTLPQWMTVTEFVENGYNLNVDYKPLMSCKELESKISESSEQYYHRSYFVTSSILSSTSANVLMVAHAASLDVCTRQLTGKTSKNEYELVKTVQEIPYCGVAVAEEVDMKQWAIIKPPIYTLMHTANQRYDWKCLLST